MQDKIKLFDTTILPILTNKENVHVRFLKQLLSVRMQMCNNATHPDGYFISLIESATGVV